MNEILIRNSNDEWFLTNHFSLVPNARLVPIEEFFVQSRQLLMHGFIENNRWIHDQHLRPDKKLLERYTWAMLQSIDIRKNND